MMKSNIMDKIDEVDAGALKRANQLFYLSNQKIEERKIHEAIEVLDKLIQEFSSYGPAYNHLGWIYANSINDFPLAEANYQLALKYSPEYPSTYINYAVLLNSLEKYEELSVILEKALQIPGVNKSKIFNEYGLMYEVKKEYEKAIDAFEKAMQYCLITAEVARYKDAIERCKMKQNFLSKA